MEPTVPEWIADLANQERERRKDHQIVVAAERVFQESLGLQVSSDLEWYYKEFPKERESIHWETGAGITVITRVRDESSLYEGTPCQARSRIQSIKMVLECRFPHRPTKDRQFKIVITAEGAIGLEDMAITDLSRYLLAPVLFDR